METETWINVAKFLNRVNLKGEEVPAFLECMKLIDEQVKNLSKECK